MRTARHGALAVMVAGVLALGAGCAHRRAEPVRQGQDAQWLYERPLAEVWPAARALLEERGYRVHEEQRQALLLTEWKDEGDGRSFSRYRVEGQPLGPQSCVVRFVRQVRGEARAHAAPAPPASGSAGAPPGGVVSRAGVAPR